MASQPCVCTDERPATTSTVEVSGAAADKTSTGRKSTPGGDGLHRLFDLAVVVKGLAGAAELLIGLLLLILAPSQLAAPLLWLSGSELGEFHPIGMLAASSAAAAADLAPATVIFVAIYLLVHGIIKVVLVAAVVSHRMWAYLWMIAALAGFIAYQTYELTVHATVGLIVLTLFDVAVVALTIREFRMQRSRNARAGGAGGSSPLRWKEATEHD